VDRPRIYDLCNANGTIHVGGNTAAPTTLSSAGGVTLQLDNKVGLRNEVGMALYSQNCGSQIHLNISHILIS
jgi:hypothetical protein